MRSGLVRAEQCLHLHHEENAWPYLPDTPVVTGAILTQ